jgi:hypothetical protein
MNIRFYSQWQWPILDFEILHIGLSHFGRHDYFVIFGTIQITILGLQVVIYRYNKNDHKD